MHTDEEEEELQEVDEVEEPAEETPAPEPAHPTGDKGGYWTMKVVIVISADKAMVGVQAPQCDPVYKTMSGDLGMALEQVPALVEEAKQKWSSTPLYPKADLPEPLPSPTPARTPTAARAPVPRSQPSFF